MSDTQKQNNLYLVHEIETNLVDVLNNAFPNDSAKRRIKKRGNVINFACPLCGDSYSDSHKKRGNIILSGKYQNAYKCFNCGAYMPVDRFFSEVRRPLSPDSVSFVKIHKPREREQTSSVNIETLEILMGEQMDLSKYLPHRSLLTSKLYINPRFSFVEVQDSVVAYNYLKGRNQLDKDTSWLLYEENSKSIAMLNLSTDGYVLGLQLKPIDKTNKNARFTTYKSDKIWKFLFNSDVKIPDPLLELSGIYNILRVDLTRPIICCEGAMDSNLLPNSIATSSAHVSPPDIVPYYYMYDDDVTGRRKSEQRLRNGDSVFMWKKLKRELMLPKREKWDWNDVVNYCKSINRKYPDKFKEYFTTSIYDKIHV